MAGAVHLARRFFGAVKPGPPSLIDERWALRQLLPGEAEIWRRMNNPDRRHAIEVARAVDARRRSWFGGPGDGPAGRRRSGEAVEPVEPSDVRAVLAAALLHDSGKVVSRLRTPARVVATVVWAVADDAVADRWLAGDPDTIRARLAQYRRHPSLGAEMLRAAGSAAITHRWAGEHHRPEASWSVPHRLGRVLKACDDD